MVIVSVFLVALIGSGIFYLTRGAPTVTHSPAHIDSRYPAIDNVSCNGLEKTTFHTHAHVSIYINGQPATIPAQVGIAGNPSQPTCYYWMHTHKADGIIHMEGPSNFTPTVGKFLDIWGQSFSSLQFHSELDQPGAPRWQVYVNGQLVNSDFHTITLQNHTLVTLAYNSPNVKPDTTFNWNSL